jgi:SAM-dependent methyltransferase
MSDPEYCAICKSPKIKSRGMYRSYIDYETPIFDCLDCGGRFSVRDDRIYEHLHTSTTSSYSGHQRYASRLKATFENGSAKELAAILSEFDKNRLIIDAVDQSARGSNILELGCSCGYLTSYAIKEGHHVLGVDLSPSAIANAVENFGDVFVTAKSDEALKRAPYDLIYHVGTIGCVEDPLEFTRTHFNLLRSGGLLVFNCPNVRFCEELGLDWMRSCSPPDLVSLFCRGVWEREFGSDAIVEVAEIRKEMPKYNLASYLGALIPKDYLFKTSPLRWRSVIRRISNRIAPRLAKVSMWFGRAELPTEYGLHVRIRKGVEKSIRI